MPKEGQIPGPKRHLNEEQKQKTERPQGTLYFLGC